MNTGDVSNWVVLFKELKYFIFDTEPDLEDRSEKDNGHHEHHEACISLHEIEILNIVLEQVVDSQQN